MAENITTVLNKNAITAEQINNEPSVENVFYVIHGTGIERDRFISLYELRKLMSRLEAVVINGDGVSTEIDAGVMELASQLFTLRIDTAQDGGIKFYEGAQAQNVGASVAYNLSTHSLVIGAQGDVIFPDGIVANGVESNEVKTDSVVPGTSGVAVSIGSQDGGVQLFGRTYGFVGNVTTDSISAPQGVSTINVGAMLAAKNVPATFVDASGFDPNDSSTYLPAQKMTEWSVGQVKRFLNNTNSDIQGIPFFSTVAGGFRTLDFPKYSYREFVCTGSCTEGGTEYAVLMVNGG